MLRPRLVPQLGRGRVFYTAFDTSTIPGATTSQTMLRNALLWLWRPPGRRPPSRSSISAGGVVNAASFARAPEFCRPRFVSDLRLAAHRRFIPRPSPFRTLAGTSVLVNGSAIPLLMYPRTDQQLLRSPGRGHLQVSSVTSVSRDEPPRRKRQPQASSQSRHQPAARRHDLIRH
jgi:hypothetical protein